MDLGMLGVSLRGGPLPAGRGGRAGRRAVPASVACPPSAVTLGSARAAGCLGILGSCGLTLRPLPLDPEPLCSPSF